MKGCDLIIMTKRKKYELLRYETSEFTADVIVKNYYDYKELEVWIGLKSSNSKVLLHCIKFAGKINYLDCIDRIINDMLTNDGFI